MVINVQVALKLFVHNAAKVAIWFLQEILHVQHVLIVNNVNMGLNVFSAKKTTILI